MQWEPFKNTLKYFMAVYSRFEDYADAFETTSNFKENESSVTGGLQLDTDSPLGTQEFSKYTLYAAYLLICDITCAYLYVFR